MRILFISHYFQPEPNFFTCLPFAKELVRRGHEVEVLTGFPNYPGGKIYPGYRGRLLQREMIEGIPVLRVPLYPSHDQSSFRRIITYTTFALSAATLGAALVKRADVSYVLQGPATVLVPARVLQLLRGIPYVCHVQDLWPDSLLSTGMFNHPVGVRMLRAWCNRAYRQADRLITITPGLKQRLIERGIPQDKIEVIYNWCDDENILNPRESRALRDELGMGDRFNVIFAGNMGKAQALGAALQAAGMLQGQCPRVQFLFIGGGVEVSDLKQKAQDMQLPNVRFHGRRPISEIGAILKLADVLFVHLRDDDLFRITIPSKTQAYMAAGRPLLMGVRGDASDLVVRAKAGIACEPENPESIAAAVMKLASLTAPERDEMGANGRAFYEKELSFAIAVDRFEAAFAQAARRR